MRPGFEVSLNESKKVIFQCFTNEQNTLVSFAEDNTSKIAVVLIGKIYYQDTLKAKFPHLSQLSYPNDAHLILALLKGNNLQALEQLEGEFALVAYYPPTNSLIALRDPLGNYPLYWLSNRDHVSISTHLHKLAESYSSKSLDRDFMASFLMFPFAFTELHTEKTIFEGIHRILPGNILQFTLKQPVKYLRQWDWQKIIDPIENISLDEAGLGFREIFRQSIQERSQTGVIASHLSGGMDSSSVVCLAKELIPQEKLITLSLIYTLPSLCGETAYINQIIEQEGRMNPYLINADQGLDFQWFNQDVPQHDEPYPGLFHFAMEKLLCEQGVELGVTTILSGGGSEFITEGNHYYLADLVYQRKLKQALKEAKTWSESTSQSLWSVLFKFGLKPLIPSAFQEGLLTWLGQGYGNFPQLGEFAIPPWIKLEFAQTHHLWLKSQDTLKQIYQYPVSASINQLNLRTASGNWASWYLSAPKNQKISKPFLDPRLISYCLSLPYALREIPSCPKPLLQTAMKNILPESIRTRQYKVSFNEVYWKGLRENLASLAEIVAYSSFKDLEIFDHTQLLTALQQHSLGLGDIKQGSRITVALALLFWYEQFFE